MSAFGQKRTLASLVLSIRNSQTLDIKKTATAGKMKYIAKMEHPEPSV